MLRLWRAIELQISFGIGFVVISWRWARCRASFKSRQVRNRRYWRVERLLVRRSREPAKESRRVEMRRPRSTAQGTMYGVWLHRSGNDSVAAERRTGRASEQVKNKRWNETSTMWQLGREASGSKGLDVDGAPGGGVG